ncbi:MAG TPA: phage protein Gp36 family protein [Armatimonadota bacterium]|jgi:hypothetical protein
MAYCDLVHVQARVPTQTLTIAEGSQPSSGQVMEWVNSDSAWIDATLLWRYQMPAAAADAGLLKPICAALVASRVYQVQAGADADYREVAEGLRKEALQLLAYDAKTGRSNLVLANTPAATTGEAQTGTPVSTFTDPDVFPSNPRMFSIGKEL